MSDYQYSALYLNNETLWLPAMCQIWHFKHAVPLFLKSELCSIHLRLVCSFCFKVSFGGSGRINSYVASGRRKQ